MTTVWPSGSLSTRSSLHSVCLSIPPDRWNDSRCRTCNSAASLEPSGRDLLCFCTHCSCTILDDDPLAGHAVALEEWPSIWPAVPPPWEVVAFRKASSFPRSVAHWPCEREAPPCEERASSEADALMAV
eukprot:CAMPEP_0179089572 /NCGR_PEP_ID=MMETSP0796-20121207/40821_1 /TAXON_ID=73915 /ORGANISM="Pyrodinium bahamense, Strain pbaha01" /LENGTH=128 /DNA_ID=CAMNT_0020787131 /DNA_START=87 /DNA_END=473 /DNA_ORIENTATION=-